MARRSLGLINKINQMKSFITPALLFFLALFCGIGCQNESSISDFESLNIELLRGDIVLCGGDQFGEVSFALFCKNTARKSFDLAISLLHSFEYDEAEKAFVKVIDEDPDCAMAFGVWRCVTFMRYGDLQQCMIWKRVL